MINKAKEILEKYNQLHVLSSYGRLSEDKKEVKCIINVRESTDS